MHMKKRIVGLSVAVFFGLSSVIGVSLVNMGHVSLDKSLGVIGAEAAGIGGNTKINGVNYKWVETSWSKNRGLTFNPGNHVYQFSPNPHNDPWYNKNQKKFYDSAADQITKQGNAGKWDQKSWPSSIKVTMNGIDYTLAPR